MLIRILNFKRIVLCGTNHSSVRNLSLKLVLLILSSLCSVLSLVQVLRFTGNSYANHRFLPAFNPSSAFIHNRFLSMYLNSSFQLQLICLKIIWNNGSSIVGWYVICSTQTEVKYYQGFVSI